MILSRFFSRFCLTAFIVCIFLLACKCSEESSGDHDPFTATIMNSGSIEDNGKEYIYHLMKLEIEENEPSYAVWFQVPGSNDVPAVLVADPYSGITWNGDTPPADVSIKTPENSFYDANIYLMNGFSVLIVFGRFYIGGDILNDVNDMAAGLMFLGRALRVMRDRIAVTGGSWGGFESLYAGAHAPAGAVPRVGVALFPVSDFERFYYYITDYLTLTITDETKRSQYINFFEPYAERIAAAAKGDYSLWTGDYLLSKLNTPYLVVHDQWDTLIPYEHSTDLVSESGGMIQGIWYMKGSPADLNTLPYGYAHGDLQVKNASDQLYSFPMYLTLSLAYLINGIALSDQVIINLYDPAALKDFVSYLKDYKDSGNDMEWAAPRLLDLADDRVLLVNANDFSVNYGDAETTRVVNEVWGTALDENNVRDYLENGLP